MKSLSKSKSFCTVRKYTSQAYSSEASLNSVILNRWLTWRKLVELIPAIDKTTFADHPVPVYKAWLRYSLKAGYNKAQMYFGWMRMI